MNAFYFVVPYFTGVVLLFVLARMILKEAGGTLADELPSGGVQFAPSSQAHAAMLVFVGAFALIGVAGTVMALIGGHGVGISLFCLAIALVLMRVLPGTITATSSGLEQRFWLGKPKRILWSDVRSVVVVQRDGRVTISSRAGGKIQHSRQLPDRDRLLAELRTHCPDAMTGDGPKSTGDKPRKWVVPPPPSKS